MRRLEQVITRLWDGCDAGEIGAPRLCCGDILDRNSIQIMIGFAKGVQWKTGFSEMPFQV